MNEAQAHELFCRKSKSIGKLPSIETQFLAWNALVSETHYHVGSGTSLKRAGFELYLRHQLYFYDRHPISILVIARIGIPEKLRGRGWLSNFEKMAFSVMCEDALSFEVVRPGLHPFLRRNGYREFPLWGRSFIRCRSGVLKDFKDYLLVRAERNEWLGVPEDAFG